MGNYISESPDGKSQVMGIFMWPNGDKYEGPLKDGMPHGTGIVTSNGKQTFRNFKHGKAIEGAKRVMNILPVDSSALKDSKGAFIHTKVRAKKRMGVAISNQLYRTTARRLASGDIPLGRYVGGGRYLAKVIWRGEEVTVVYDKNAKVIVTTLPKK